MLKTSFAIFSLVLLSFASHGQAIGLGGKVVDASDSTQVVGASVLVFLQSDSNSRHAVQTDSVGKFGFSSLAPNKYVVKISYLGYRPLYVKVALGQTNIYLGTLKLKSIDFKEVKVIGHQIRAEQLGDTVQYHADAFKTNPDANAEDLITKMPGITVNNGTVQAHGEDVKQVLVDGKPYFGDDPTTALRNLPSEIVDKVQVFDKMSEQSQFTGFDDGNSQKTINIITKKNRQNGQFGRGVVGYGTDNRYQASETLNLFNNNQRISIIGLSNNINQQNFSTQDLLGVMGSSGQRNNGGGRMGAAIGGPRGGNHGGYTPPGSNISNFLVGQQGGNNITNSAGLNYSDSIGKKFYITGSYFFNNTNNNTQSSLARRYFNGLLYNEGDTANSINYNHRANIRMEYAIDTLNSLVFTPKFSYQNTTISSMMNGATASPEGSQINSTSNRYGQNSNGYDLNANLLWRHKFSKPGRTLSWNIGTDINPKNATDSLQSISRYYGVKDSTASINQHSSAPSHSINFNTSLSYTEPLSKTSQLQISYNPSYTQNDLDKRTYTKTGNGDNGILDSVLSNNYNYTTRTNKGGASYRARIKDINFSVGVNFQNAMLTGTQLLPVTLVDTKTYTFNNILPTAMFSEKFENKANIRVMYNTSANMPSISQLQDVVNNTNPLLLTAGNSRLVQSYNNSLIVRYGKTNTDKAHSFFVFAAVTNTSNYIGSSTAIAFRDSVLPSGLKLAKGSEITMPVNLNNYWSARAFATFGLPMDFMKSNLNLNGGLTYNSTPGLLNNVLNYTNTYAINPGLVLSSNISEKVDYTLSYSGSYNIVKNSINAQANNNYFSHTAALKFNWIFYKGFTLSTDISHTLYTGLSGAYNQSLLLVNAGIGKKLFKEQNGEIKLSVFDLLNQNSAVTTTVNDTYIDDVRTQVLQRYIMLTFSYNLKHFVAGAAR
jgi:hypothetical protein